VKRPVILVDLDNVVYNFINVMAVIVSTYLRPDYDPNQLVQLYRSWEIWEDWGIPKGQFDLVWERGIRDGAIYGAADGNPAAAPIEGAREALWTLSDAEWHIHLVTSRLNKFRLHDQVVENTVQWLKGWGIPYRSLSFTEDKHAITGQAIVDDKASHLIGHPADNRFLFPAAHNTDDRIETPEYTVLSEDFPWDELVETLT
jgi:hypothetical protein